MSMSFQLAGSLSKVLDRVLGPVPQQIADCFGRPAMPVPRARDLQIPRGERARQCDARQTKCPKAGQQHSRVSRTVACAIHAGRTIPLARRKAPEHAGDERPEDLAFGLDQMSEDLFGTPLVWTRVTRELVLGSGERALDLGQTRFELARDTFDVLG